MRAVIDKNIDHYLEFADDRTRAFLAAPPDAYILMKEVDALMRDLFSSGVLNASPIGSFLNLNAYYQLMSAVRVAISGHVSAVFPLVRAALESACYAHFIGDNQERQMVWLHRDRTVPEGKAFRRMFGSAIKQTTDSLKAVDQDLANYVAALYEGSITFGAHPNSYSVMRHLQPGECDETHWKVELVCMYAETSQEVRAALVACTEYGLGIAALAMAAMAAEPLLNPWKLRWNQLHERKDAVAAASPQ